MKIARLSEKITIEKCTTVVDENANHRDQWDEYYTCSTYAMASSYKQKESEKAGVIVPTNDLDFSVRYCSELADIDSVNYRVKFHDMVFNITSIDWMNYDHKSIKICCAKERKDTGVKKQYQGQH